MAIWHCRQYEIMIPTSTHLSPDFPACDNGCILTWTETAAESVATESAIAQSIQRPLKQLCWCG
jgi:hypothetical protein